MALLRRIAAHGSRCSRPGCPRQPAGGAASSGSIAVDGPNLQLPSGGAFCSEKFRRSRRAGMRPGRVWIQLPEIDRLRLASSDFSRASRDSGAERRDSGPASKDAEVASRDIGPPSGDAGPARAPADRCLETLKGSLATPGRCLRTPVRCQQTLNARPETPRPGGAPAGRGRRAKCLTLKVPEAGVEPARPCGRWI